MNLFGGKQQQEVGKPPSIDEAINKEMRRVQVELATRGPIPVIADDSTISHWIRANPDGTTYKSDTPFDIGVDT